MKSGDLLLLGGVGVALYLVYQAGGSGFPSIPNLFNRFTAGSTADVYAQPSAVPGQTSIAQSFGGHDMLDSKGGKWACTGGTSSMCTPIECSCNWFAGLFGCDPSQNCTATGTPIPEGQVSLAGYRLPAGVVRA